MKVMGLWGMMLLLSFLVLALVVFYGEPTRNSGGSSTVDEVVAHLEVGGIRLVGGNEFLSERNPFQYAPVRKSRQQQKALGNAIAASDSAFPVMSLEGILVRREKPAAFMHYRGQRKVVSEGEEIVSGIFLEQVDRESIVIANRLGERRRLYLVD